MSTVVTQADFCSSVASSTVSPTDFRRAWITPTSETNAIVPTQYDDSAKLLQNTHQTHPTITTTQPTVDHGDEVAVHPLSNQVRNIYSHSPYTISLFANYCRIVLTTIRVRRSGGEWTNASFAFSILDSVSCALWNSTNSPCPCRAGISSIIKSKNMRKQSFRWPTGEISAFSTINRGGAARFDLHRNVL